MATTTTTPPTHTMGRVYPVGWQSDMFTVECSCGWLALLPAVLAPTAKRRAIAAHDAHLVELLVSEVCP